MKIKILKGTNLPGGKTVDPGEVHDVDHETMIRFVHIHKDAELVTEDEASAPNEEKKKGKRV